MRAVDRSQPMPAESRSAQADAALRRLRWRARRGLLENDLLIGRFLEGQGDALGPAQADALARLLELPDIELLGLLLGRGRPPGDLDTAPVRDLLERLRATRAGERPAAEGL